ncbi:MAG TPA: sialidase family protein [Chthoniobacteraceae bacterium]|nr:sialidase family protein [Chthoniobacteraceae bacterium]
MNPPLSFTLLEDHRHDGERSGEGSAVALNDGRLLLMYSAFRGGGGSDHSPGTIFQRTSGDGGATWSASSPVFAVPQGALNLMSVSLLRLRDGRIGCIYLVKWTQGTHCVPYWTTSSDEGESWAAPTLVTPLEEYFVVNHDRLIQLRDGTLVLPYAWHGALHPNGDDTAPFREELNARCGIFYSRDGGKSWTRPDTARRFEPGWFTPPSPFRPEKAHPDALKIIDKRYDVFQEPGVVELSDGRLMMWARSLSHLYHSRLGDLDGEWEPFRAIPGFNVCCGPQTIQRLPGSDRLVMLYNDRGEFGFGEPGYTLRTPLSVAVSDDGGECWQRLAPLEGDDSKNYCYFSLLFFGERFLATYYESVPRLEADGTPARDAHGLPKRRNLASLKVCRGESAFFRAI